MVLGTCFTYSGREREVMERVCSEDYVIPFSKAHDNLDPNHKNQINFK